MIVRVRIRGWAAHYAYESPHKDRMCVLAYTQIREGKEKGGEKGVGGKIGWLTLTEIDRGERAAGFVFPADPNTEPFLTRPTRHGVTE